MKPVLFLAGALLLAATPALTQTSDPGPAPAAPSPNTASGPNSFVDSPFVGPDRRISKQCFEGARIAGVNRAGNRTLYVQGERGAIFRVDLARECGALDAAVGLKLRSSSDGIVCSGEAAILSVKTAEGAKRCVASKVSRLTRTEVATLATAVRR